MNDAGSTTTVFPFPNLTRASGAKAVVTTVSVSSNAACGTGSVLPSPSS